MLLTHIAEIADEPLSLDPNDLDAETRTNTWSMSAPPDERATLSVDQIVTAFVDTATRLGRRIAGLGPGSGATFYVWHDAQAGQLRCSTSSQPEHALPFRTNCTTTALEPIITAFLDDPQPALIAWNELAATESTTTLTTPRTHSTSGYTPSDGTLQTHPTVDKTHRGTPTPRTHCTILTCGCSLLQCQSA